MFLAHRNPTSTHHLSLLMLPRVAGPRPEARCGPLRDARQQQLRPGSLLLHSMRPGWQAQLRESSSKSRLALSTHGRPTEGAARSALQRQQVTKTAITTPNLNMMLAGSIQLMSA
jgi:hypothetical protein